jgi:hypothetical protein
MLALGSQTGQLYRLLDEVSRRLHNFLASAKTLVDHTRVHVRTIHSGTQFEEEYREEVASRFSQSSITKFVHCLRNYNLHYRIPLINVSTNIRLEPGGQVTEMRQQISLRADILRSWSGWDKLAKRYLTEAGEQLSVERLAADYMRVMSPFYEWFRARDQSV